MKTFITAIISIILTALPTYGQRNDVFKVMFWNVENLFDTSHDDGKNDEEFTASGKMHWDTGKMKRKLDNIARVIAIAGDSLPPAIVGLCEVENDNVMTNLTRWSPLGNLGYRYIMTSSADKRGIDVALLYQPDLFRLISQEAITPIIKGQPFVRDILHVSGMIPTGDTLDIIVAHLPSRREGAKVTEPRRIAVAQRIRSISDSITCLRGKPHIIIMGDFNDYPTNNSIKRGIKAVAPESNPNPNSLYHLFLTQQHQKGESGSYKYQGLWDFLDHIIVNGMLLDSKQSVYTSSDKAGELRIPFLLTEDKRYGGTKPFRTYNGPTYNGGISDHLPVYADFTVHY